MLHIVCMETGVTDMTAKEKEMIAMRFLAEGNRAVYDAIIASLTDEELLELLEE